MALRKEIRVEEIEFRTNNETLKRNVEKEVLVYDFICDEPGCKTKIGEHVFSVVHGRKSDADLESEIKAQYSSHRCDKHPLK